MSRKKKARKRNRSRKGKMPAGLRKWMEKQRATKNRRKRNSSRSRRRRSNPRKRARKQSVLSQLKRIGYEIVPKANRRRRRNRKRNPLRKAKEVRLHGHYSPRQLREIKRALARVSGRRVLSK